MTTSTRVAIGAFLFASAAMAAAMVLWVTGVDEPFTPDIAIYPAAYLAFAGVGALIASRQPGHRIGRLCLLVGVLGSGVALADSYARLASPMPAQAWAAWVMSWAFPATFAPIAAVLLLFPNGHLASRRWVPVGWLVGIGAGLVGFGSAFTPTFPDRPDMPNPVGQAWLAGSPLEGGGIGWILVLAGMVAAAVGLVTRLRGSHGVERQQLKLVTFAASLNGVTWLILALDLPGTAGELVGYAVFATFATVPIAIGVAMLRYRLYDFDLIIRRTLVYGALTVVLGAAYAGLVLFLQALVSPFTGSNVLAVALSTLAVAALFGPVRRRLQRMVDRRFYRSRYDAQRTLDAFAARLRDEVDLPSLTAELHAVTRATVQPTTVSVWLRKNIS